MCIASWKKYLPDYEIKEWNEDNFDVKCLPYVQEAYEARKYAFVTDYVRLYALYMEGGIYMDTDVEVVKNLDVFLNLSAFSGFETYKLRIQTGIMGSEKGGIWAKRMLEYYDGRHFITPQGYYDVTTNVKIITKLMKPYGFKSNNKKQTIASITFYPKDYFCPKDYRTGEVVMTENTYCIHHYAGSWTETDASKLKKKSWLSRMFKKIKGIIRNIFHV